MKTKISTWGNSLAVRIPKAFAGELGLVSEAEVDIRLDHGTIVMAPVAPYRISLVSLLDKIDDKNIHDEIDTRGAVGSESW